MTRLGKQLIYGGAYLAILTLIFVGVYRVFLRPAASCVNGLKDTGEEAVDCGGVCSNICLPSNLRQIAVKEPLLFSPIPSKLAILTKLQNANQDIAARSFDYRVTLLEWGSTSTLRTIKGTEYMYAGEVKYLTLFVDDIEKSMVGDVKTVVSNVRWVSSKTFYKPELSVQDRKTDITTSTILVTGRIVNRDTLDLPSVRIIAILQGGGLLTHELGVSATEIENMTAGSSREFSITYPFIDGVDPGKTDIIVSAARP